MKYDVVIPAFNASETIKEALNSVLSQTLKPVSVIVVNDGSTDDTAALAAAFSPLVTVLEQANQGPGKATSLGMRACTSALIALLDADDIWLPEKMARQIAALTERPDVSLVFSQQRQFHHEDPNRSNGEVRAGLNRSSMLAWRGVFDDIGDIIDPPGNRGDMIDWLARAREAGYGLHVLDEVLCLRRIMPGSLSFGRDREKDRGYLAIAYRAMRRRKLNNEG